MLRMRGQVRWEHERAARAEQEAAVRAADGALAARLRQLDDTLRHQAEVVHILRSVPLRGSPISFAQTIDLRCTLHLCQQMHRAGTGQHPREGDPGGTLGAWGCPDVGRQLCFDAVQPAA